MMHNCRVRSITSSWREMLINPEVLRIRDAYIYFKMTHNTIDFSTFFYKRLPIDNLRVLNFKERFKMWFEEII